MNGFRASNSRRLPLPPADTWSAETREAVHRVVEGPRGALLGPFVPLARSAGLLDSVQAVGEFLRYRSGLQGTVLETLVLTVAAHWDAAYEWSHHAPIAAAAGMAPECIEAIQQGREPRGDAEVAAVWTVVQKLVHSGDLDERTYRAAVERWGERQTVEIVAATGYYTMLGWILNVAQVVPDDQDDQES